MFISVADVTESGEAIRINSLLKKLLILIYN